MDCSLEFTECQATRYLWLILSPAILVIGTVGNTLIILVTLRTPMRSTSFGSYLIAMAITDSIAIWTGLSRHFAISLLNFDVRLASSLGCQIQQFLLYGSMDTSVYILLAATAERTLAIFQPQIAKKMIRVRRAVAVILTVALIMFGLNSQALFTRGDDYIGGNTNTTNHCGYTSASAQYYWEHTHYYLALTFYSVLPFIFTLFMNAAIIYKVKTRQRHFRTFSYSASVISIDSPTECSSSTQSPRTPPMELSKPKVSTKTLMLLPVTMLFLIATFPSLTITIVNENMQNKTESTRANMAVLRMAFLTLKYLNHSINFFLYCLVGANYRKQCRTVISRLLKSVCPNYRSWICFHNEPVLRGKIERRRKVFLY